MRKVIVYQNPDGTTSVVSPAPQARGKVLVKPAEFAERVEYVPGVEDVEIAPGVIEKRVVAIERTVQVEIAPAEYRDETDDEFLPRVAAGSVPQGVQWRAVDASAFPQDRMLRRAWTLSEGRVVEDVAKARALLAEEASKLTRAQAALSEIDKAQTPERLKELLVSLRAELD